MSAPRRPGRGKSRSAAHRPRNRWAVTAAFAGLGACVVAALFGGYVWLSQPGRLPLRVIEVNGVFRHLNRIEIQQVVSDAIDGGFFTCDMDHLRRAVLSMPWVDDVSVRRSWPDRLSMTVIEQVPLARWGQGGLINAHGAVFEPSSVEPFAGLVLLNGPAGSALRVVDFYQRAAAGTRQRGLRLQAVELDERRHWWLRFDGDLTVSLGREQVDRRLQQFLRVYPTLVSESARRPQRIDMRYAHGFAVRWQADDRDGAGTQRTSTGDQA